MASQSHDEPEAGSQIMNRAHFLASLVCGVCTFCTPADASTITPIVDDFNDGSLSTAWSVGFENATGWTFVESGGLLTVTDIDATVVNAGSGGPMARVNLSQTFTPLTDFTASCAVAWDSEDSVRAMQGVGLQLFDGNGLRVAGLEYADGWVGFRGTQRWFFDAITTGISPRGLLPFSGTALLGISRVGSDISVSWNGNPLATGSSSSPIARVDLYYWHYAFDSVFDGTSFFGTESIDSVTITGSAVTVPEPSSMLLMGAGVWCLAVMRLRRRT